jgi:hypothetical protein
MLDDTPGATSNTTDVIMGQPASGVDLRTNQVADVRATKRPMASLGGT